MSDLMKACPECGEVSEETYCPAHRKPPRKRPWRTVGYNARWDRLSKRARRMQPFCTVCGTTKDLTADHSPEAWERERAGLPIRLEDIDVLCRSHNASKGAARNREDWA